MSIFKQSKIRSDVVSEMVEHVRVDGRDGFPVVQLFIVFANHCFDIGERDSRLRPAVWANDRDLW